MTEAAYLTAFGWATDALFRYIGDDEEYRAGGHSFYTVETHINYLREVNGSGSLRFGTRLVGLDSKRLHLYHEMFDDSNGELVAATEQMLLHMNTVTGQPAAIEGNPAVALAAIREAHRGLSTPEYLGRVMATKGRGMNFDLTAEQRLIVGRSGRVRRAGALPPRGGSGALGHGADGVGGPDQVAGHRRRDIRRQHARRIRGRGPGLP